MIAHYYFVEWDFDGYEGFVSLNGFGLTRPWRAGFDQAVIPVSHWMVTGENRLELTLLQPGDPRPKPEEPPEEPPDRRAVVVVGYEHDLPEGSFPGESAFETLVELYTDCHALDERALPQTVSTTFDHRSPFPRWRWQDAEPVIALDETSMAELAALVTGMRTKFERRDMSAIMAELEIPIRERAVTASCPTDKLAGELRGLYEQMFADDGFALAPFDPAKLHAKPHCDGRMFELLERSGEDAVRQSDDAEDQWTLSLLVGRLNGHWTILSMV